MTRRREHEPKASSRIDFSSLRVDGDPSQPIRVGTEWTSKDQRDNGRTVTVLQNDAVVAGRRRYVVTSGVRRTSVSEETLLTRYFVRGFNPRCQYTADPRSSHSQDVVAAYVGRASGPVTLCGKHAQGSLTDVLRTIPEPEGH